MRHHFDSKLSLQKTINISLNTLSSTHQLDWGTLSICERYTPVNWRFVTQQKFCLHLKASVKIHLDLPSFATNQLEV